MKQDNIIIPLEQEPITNIDFHISPLGQLSNTILRDVVKLSVMYFQLEDLLKIISPFYIHYNIDHWKQLRDDTSKPSQIRINYHNRMKRMFMSANMLLSKMTIKDEKYLGFTRKEVIEILKTKRIEYEIDTFRKDLLKR